jgi:molybdopterin-guanine dinucleotide biosynthesis protein A
MAIPGLLLTGGASRRMGVPKATLELDGERLVDRAAAALLAVCEPVLELGPGYTSLPVAPEDPPGRGPLAALVAGADAVSTAGPVVLLACDLLFVADLVARVSSWPGTTTVVPVDPDGVLQPVCARYSATAITAARTLLDAGERSLRVLVDGLDASDVIRLTDVDPHDLVDVDTPAEAARWGVRDPGSLAP